MKQRSLVVAAIAMMPFAVTVAQTPPTPPSKPTPAAPVTKPTPATPLIPLYPDMIDREEIRRISEEARYQGQIAAEEGRRIGEEARRAAEDARWQIQSNLKDFKFDFDHDFKFDFDHDFKFDFKFDGPDFKFDAPKVSLQAPNFNFTPKPGQGATMWLPGQQQQYQDPADSAYEVAAQAFGRQDYSRAAAKFAEMMTKFPNSRRYTQAAYNQAFALYRVGTLESLRTSLKVLETNGQRFDYDYNRQYRTDVPQLQARVLRALSDRNEPGVDAKLRDLVAKFPAATCDKEKINIQSQVLNSLYETDPESALPYIRQHLATRDACTAGLRENALWQLAKRGTDENTNLIVQIAKTDTVRSVRSRAIEVLSRMPGDAAIVALQQFMTDDDEQIQSAAVRSLMRSDNPKARAAMRQLIDRKESPERQRLDAIRSFDRDNTTPDDAAYLRALFNRANESDRIKEAVISALTNVPTEDNLKFLMDVASNQNESSNIRNIALRAVTRRQNLTTDNLIKLYDATDNRSMRNSLVDALAQRPEPAAVNKLLDIVKSSTDPDVRSNAITELLRKNDKVITQKVLDLIK